ncbi:hypothetical protein UA08_06215 [Talaromyces atroroseus]|uniref:Ribosomal RNA-processing protein 7 C-terminal domain-containing protein n=1 Tax=Talaromyces atroroseus TaxID=1441469 RepID=A0A225AGS8_TALAT|nr:hypothetical protein UA08_06215 [Talaromyces atroroseus]OKL58393.1 hypothetical protein UA08_06215 [Talaromyces atroroseus]
MPKKSSSIEISGYTVLPLRLPATPSFPSPATHYLYLRAHEPRIPDADAPRSLFLVNLPIDTTELHLRHLFSSQLSAGRVEKVHFGSTATSAATTTTVSTTASEAGQGKKRKRDEITASDLQNQLENVKLPSTWDRALHASGSHAVVTFVDRPAMEASLKAARKAARSRSRSTEGEKKNKGITIPWAEGIEDRVPNLGASRYQKHCNELRFPAADELSGIVNEYMSLFAQVEETRARESARRAQEPDEDGFVTVTKGPRLTDLAAREEEVRELVEKQKRREEGLGDFYRFQTREKRKERQNDLLKRFDEDRRKIEKLKRGRGGIMGLHLVRYISQFQYSQHGNSTRSDTMIASNPNYVVRPSPHGYSNINTPTTMNTTNTTGAEEGGFLNPTLPSPAPTTSTSTNTTSTITLPRQRIHPLKPGGAKESSLINHVDRKILRINRRHAKKFSSALRGADADDTVTGSMRDADAEDGEGEAKGYESFTEVARDIEEVIDVVWVSGTPSLQIPYLISLAGLVNTYLPEYPLGAAAAKQTFRLLRKFDVMFASLLVGEDVESGIPLSGFEAGRAGYVSMTEKVRIKSVAETSRIVVVEMEVGDDVDDEDEDEDGMDIDGGDDDDDDAATETRTWEMEAARVYERTIQYLGDELGKAELG